LWRCAGSLAPCGGWQALAPNGDCPLHATAGQHASRGGTGNDWPGGRQFTSLSTLFTVEQPSPLGPYPRCLVSLSLWIFARRKVTPPRAPDPPDAALFAFGGTQLPIQEDVPSPAAAPADISHSWRHASEEVEISPVNADRNEGMIGNNVKVGTGNLLSDAAGFVRHRGPETTWRQPSKLFDASAFHSGSLCSGIAFN
jgi:hypothetical protein